MVEENETVLPNPSSRFDIPKNSTFLQVGNAVLKDRKSSELQGENLSPSNSEIHWSQDLQEQCPRWAGPVLVEAPLGPAAMHRSFSILCCSLSTPSSRLTLSDEERKCSWWPNLVWPNGKRPRMKRGLHSIWKRPCRSGSIAASKFCVQDTLAWFSCEFHQWTLSGGYRKDLKQEQEFKPSKECVLPLTFTLPRMTSAQRSNDSKIKLFVDVGSKVYKTTSPKISFSGFTECPVRKDSNRLLASDFSIMNSFW